MLAGCASAADSFDVKLAFSVAEFEDYARVTGEFSSVTGVTMVAIL